MNMINYFVMDVDGTLTDGKIYMGEAGELFKTFNIKDGYGIVHLLPNVGAIPVIITGRKSKILETRCSELGITELYQGISDKVSVLKKLVGEDQSMVWYIGDDLNDLECMKWVKSKNGIVGCPKDAADQVRAIADHVSTNNGGEGAVRDFIEWIISTIPMNC